MQLFLSSMKSKDYLLGIARGVDVNMRTDSMLRLIIGDKIWPQYEQLSIFFLFFWPHLGLN